MLRVRQLWRYPVKSLQGERLTTAEIGPHGIPGDRAFGIVDDATGLVLTARREPRLLFASATWHDGDVALVDADGRSLSSDAALSDWLGRPVRLVRAGAEGGTYEAPADSEHEADWVRWQGPGHAWHDSARTRVSLVSTATLGSWAPARFRANVLLDGHGEDTLVGRKVRLGACVLDVVKQIDRCVVVTRAQAALPVDRDVLRTIHRERGGFLAVGALVDRPGAVGVGDRLTAAS
jgi:uncharacterized protein YcbX